MKKFIKIFWFFYFSNQYLYRFLKGTYDLERATTELKLEMEFSKKRINNNE